ncbi:MAG: glycosyltransferase family 4 protein [Flavobacteriaceae bacterium]|nr:glycosyltransferase family 4 protein [Flavobacteriaceae bacterium]
MPIKEPLKIFVDAYLLNKEYQGTRTYIKELYIEFAKRNRKAVVSFGCFEDERIVDEFSDVPNIHFIFYETTNRFKRMLFEIPKLIKSNDFDIAHFQYVIPFSRNKSTKYIVTIHDILFNDFKDQFSFSYRLKRNFLFKYSARKSNFLTTVSSYSKERLRSVYKLKKEIYITKNGVKSDYFKEYDKQKEINYINERYKIKDYLLYISRIEPRKNQQAVIHAFSKIKNKELSLVFIGNKSIQNSNLDKILASLNDEEKSKIHFFDSVPEIELLSFIRGAKVFVYPSVAEGFGIPPLEAAAVKIPVLCSNATAMNDFNFFSPFHIDFHDNEKVVENLKELIFFKDDKKLNDISAIVQNKYSWEKASIVLESIIKNA